MHVQLGFIMCDRLIKQLHCPLSGSRHIFLGFTKCGRYVLSYTSDCGEDDDFSFYSYHLYWWEFNLHSRLKQVKCVLASSFISKQTTKANSFPHPPVGIGARRLWIIQLNICLSCPFPNICFMSLGPSCAPVCRRGNLQWPLPDCVWVAKWPLQNCHLWFQVSTKHIDH